MKVVVTGASGLLGRALVRALRADGHEVLRLVRRAPRTRRRAPLGPAARPLDPARSPASTPWSTWPARRRRPAVDRAATSSGCSTSRVDSTDDDQRGAGRRGRRRPRPPRVLLSALGGRLLRRHRRPRCRRGAPRRRRTSSPSVVRPVGGRDRARRGGRRPGRPRCAPGWCSAAAALLSTVLGPLFRLGLGGRLGIGPAVLAVDHPAPTRSARSGFLLDRRRLRPGQPHRARAGDQRRVHRGARPGAAPADAAAGPALAHALALGEFGRRASSAGSAPCPTRLLDAGLHLRPPRPSSRPCGRPSPAG